MEKLMVLVIACVRGEETPLYDYVVENELRKEFEEIFHNLQGKLVCHYEPSSQEANMLWESHLEEHWEQSGINEYPTGVYYTGTMEVEERMYRWNKRCRRLERMIDRLLKILVEIEKNHPAEEVTEVPF